VNREDDMRRLLDWGVDGIQTDRPDILSAVLTERVGRPVPPGARTETGL
jgi:glycerophosphoryl diester phosphodiesterase